MQNSIFQEKQEVTNPISMYKLLYSAINLN